MSRPLAAAHQLATAYQLVIVDLDGVVYLGTQAVPGAATAIRSVVGDGTPVAFVTNNASRSADDVARLLADMGIPARPRQVLTAGRVAAELLGADLPPAAPVLVVGAPALRAEVAAAGLTPVATADERPIAVVQGYGPQVDWPQLAEACIAIRTGARWIATNVDATMPSPRGPLPGNGSLVAAVAVALGRDGPDAVVGKPAPTLFRAAAARAGARSALVVGDRLDTDVAAATAAGMDSLLVLTGVSTATDVLSAPAGQRPTHVASDLTALSRPDGFSRVPAWDSIRLGGARMAGWSATHDGDLLALDGAGAPPAALLVLTAAAWAHPHWSGVAARSTMARRAVQTLGLSGPAGIPATTSSTAARRRPSLPTPAPAQAPMPPPG